MCVVFMALAYRSSVGVFNAPVVLLCVQVNGVKCVCVVTGGRVRLGRWGAAVVCLPHVTVRWVSRACTAKPRSTTVKVTRVAISAAVRRSRVDTVVCVSRATREMGAS